MKAIDAHLRASEKNNAGKRGQHLVAATVIADAEGVPHFGRYNETTLASRSGRAAERKRLEKFKR